MDLSLLIPHFAAQLGVAPSSLVFYLFVLSIGCRAIARAIPDDATGWLAFIRRLSAVIGVEVASRVTSGVTVKDVARAALETPPIPDKIQEAEPVSPTVDQPVDRL